MDNKDQQQGGPQPQNNQMSQGNHAVSPGGGMKVIKPLSNDAKPEQAASRQIPPPFDASQQQNNYPNPELSPHPKRPDPSSIYPDAKKDIPAAADEPTGDNPQGDLSKVTYDSGYDLGGTIFIYQLIAGIVFGLIFYVLGISVFKTDSLTLIATIGLFHFVIEYLVLIYLPYKVLNSNAIADPKWLTVFGVAVQSVTVAVAFEFLNLLVFRHMHVLTYGAIRVAIIFDVVFLIVAYFLTKYSWGGAFLMYAKITNRMLVKLIGIGIISIFVGVIAIHFMMSSNKMHSGSLQNPAKSSQSGGLTSYTVTGDTVYSIDFYKDSSETSVQGKEVLLYSKQIGQQSYVELEKTGNQTDACPASIPASFNFSIQGGKGLGCYSTSGSDGYVQVGGQNYILRLRNSNMTQSMALTQTIFVSLVIH